MDALLGFALTLVTAALAALGLKRLNISPIAGYIMAGLIIGPALRIVDPASEYVVFASNIGIALISFEIGLTAKLGFLRRQGHEIGMVSILELFSVVFLTAVFGISLGLPSIVMLIIGLMAIDSSTAIAFKLVKSAGRLSERAAVLILSVGTVEDFIVMAGISLIPAFSQLGRLQIEGAFYAISFVVMTVLVTLVVSLQILPKIFAYVSKGNDQEVTVLMLLAVAIGFGWLGSYMGLSFSLGAFIAGLAISSIDLPKEAMSRMVSLRDLFAIIFFISVGLSIPGIERIETLVFSVVVAFAIIALKSFSFTTAAWLGGNRLNEAIRMGIYMLPISEFAMIVASEGFKYGFVGGDLFMASALAIVFSVMLSSRLVENDEEVAGRIAALVPSRIKIGIEAMSTRMRRAMIEGLLRVGEGRRVLMGIGGKVLTVAAVASVGSIIIQALGEIPIGGELVIAAQLATAMMVAFIALIETLRLGKDLGKIGELTLPKTEERSRAMKILKNGLYAIIVLIVAVVLIFNGVLFVRRILPEYYGIATVNLFTFAMIFVLVSIVFYFSYGRIKKMLETLERTVEEM